MPTPSTDAPAFGNAASYISDVQLSHRLSPEKSANSILFDNFEVTLASGGPSIETRTLSIVYPLTGIKTETPLVAELRGHADLLPGTRGMLVFRLLGVTNVLDPFPGPGETMPGEFYRRLEIKIPPGVDLRMTITMTVERDGTDQTAQASLGLGAMDLTLPQPQAKK
jgi:hypothetical protein